MAGQEGDMATFTLRKDRRYRATLRLNGFEQFAGNDIVQDKLTVVGFKDVTVTGSGATRDAEGTWTKPDITGEIDSHVIKVVQLA
jgi:hypothetical protein